MGASDPLPDWVRFIIVPILIGVLSAGLGAFFNYLSSRSEIKRTMRNMQMAKAVEVCTKVIDTFDKLYSNFQYSAWYVAWRKAIPPTADYVGSDLQKEDEQQWTDYNAALTTLREHQLEYETELKGSFGDNGIEPMLFLEIYAVCNEIADKLSMIYHSNEMGDSTVCLGEGTPCLEIPKEGFTEKDRLKSREECVLLFAFTRCRIKILSVTMINCIQHQNVGTLRGNGNGAEAELRPDLARELKETEIYKKAGAPELLCNC
mmetsp:Transcript_8998/g.21384  ORF Transcript_8998/g.21384 Transcript_8998/m.21384 type:complete len:261 (+) Transcript_8998:167-949(+)